MGIELTVLKRLCPVAKYNQAPHDQAQVEREPLVLTLFLELLKESATPASET